MQSQMNSRLTLIECLKFCSRDAGFTFCDIQREENYIVDDQLEPNTDPFDANCKNCYLVNVDDILPDHCSQDEFSVTKKPVSVRLRRNYVDLILIDVADDEHKRVNLERKIIGNGKPGDACHLLIDTSLGGEFVDHNLFPSSEHPNFISQWDVIKMYTKKWLLENKKDVFVDMQLHLEYQDSAFPHRPSHITYCLAFFNIDPSRTSMYKSSNSDIGGMLHDINLHMAQQLSYTTLFTIADQCLKMTALERDAMMKDNRCNDDGTLDTTVASGNDVNNECDEDCDSDSSSEDSEDEIAMLPTRFKLYKCLEYKSTDAGDTYVLDSESELNEYIINDYLESEEDPFEIASPSLCVHTALKIKSRKKETVIPVSARLRFGIEEIFNNLTLEQLSTEAWLKSKAFTQEVKSRGIFGDSCCLVIDHSLGGKFVDYNSFPSAKSMPIWWQSMLMSLKVWLFKNQQNVQIKVDLQISIDYDDEKNPCRPTGFHYKIALFTPESLPIDYEFRFIPIPHNSLVISIKKLNECLHEHAAMASNRWDETKKQIPVKVIYIDVEDESDNDDDTFSFWDLVPVVGNIRTMKSGVKDLKKGKKLMGAFKLGMGAAFLVSDVVMIGAAASAIKGLVTTGAKVAGETTLQSAVSATGKQVSKRAAKRAAKRLALKAAQEVGEQGVRSVGISCVQQGAENVVKTVSKKAAKRAARKLAEKGAKAVTKNIVQQGTSAAIKGTAKSGASVVVTKSTGAVVKNVVQKGATTAGKNAVKKGSATVVKQSLKTGTTSVAKSTFQQGGSTAVTKTLTHVAPVGTSTLKETAANVLKGTITAVGVLQRHKEPIGKVMEHVKNVFNPEKRGDNKNGTPASAGNDNDISANNSMGPAAPDERCSNTPYPPYTPSNPFNTIPAPLSGQRKNANNGSNAEKPDAGNISNSKRKTANTPHCASPVRHVDQAINDQESEGRRTEAHPLFISPPQKESSNQAFHMNPEPKSNFASAEQRSTADRDVIGDAIENFKMTLLAQKRDNCGSQSTIENHTTAPIFQAAPPNENRCSNTPYNPPLGCLGAQPPLSSEQTENANYISNAEIRGPCLPDIASQESNCNREYSKNVTYENHPQTSGNQMHLQKEYSRPVLPPQHANSHVAFHSRNHPYTEQWNRGIVHSISSQSATLRPPPFSSQCRISDQSFQFTEPPPSLERQGLPYNSNRAQAASHFNAPFPPCWEYPDQGFRRKADDPPPSQHWNHASAINGNGATADDRYSQRHYVSGNHCAINKAEHWTQDPIEKQVKNCIVIKRAGWNLTERLQEQVVQFFMNLIQLRVQIRSSCFINQHDVLVELTDNQQKNEVLLKSKKVLQKQRTSIFVNDYCTSMSSIPSKPNENGATQNFNMPVPILRNCIVIKRGIWNQNEEIIKQVSKFFCENLQVYVTIKTAYFLPTQSRMLRVEFFDIADKIRVLDQGVVKLKRLGSTIRIEDDRSHCKVKTEI